VLGVDHEELDTGRLEEVVDGLPVSPGRIHRDVRDGPREEPVRELEEVSDHRPERAGLRCLVSDYAGDDALLGAVVSSGALRTRSDTGKPLAADLVLPRGSGFYDVRQIAVNGVEPTYSATSAGGVIEVRGL